jgi:cell division protein FtsQ
MPRVKVNAKLYSTGGRITGGGSALPWQRPLLIAGCVFALIIGSIVLWHNGWPQRQAQNLSETLLATTGDLGFNLQDVEIEGRDHIDKEDLLEALQVERGMPTLALDRHIMLARLQKMPWLAEATIERRFPSSLLVKLTERQPLARWQYQNQVQVVDREGQPITSAAVKDFSDLPLIVGAGGAERAYDLLTALEQHPDVKKVLRAAICVGERRWDLQLEPGVMVRLPEGKEAFGLRKLSTLIADPQILSREVQSIDLRLPDRMTIERPISSIANTKTAKTVLKH